jgi:hypothetical protein
MDGLLERESLLALFLLLPVVPAEVTLASDRARKLALPWGSPPTLTGRRGVDGGAIEVFHKC